jgi:RimJ/RimL family protein N-acetyltransferase
VTPSQNARVELAPLRDSDSSLLFEWINTRELVVLSAPFRPVSREAHDAWFDDIRSRPDVRIFGIRLLGEDRLIGSCQLHSIHPVHRNAELQIRVGDGRARGRGLGTEAVRLLLGFGFDELDLHRIFLRVFETNEAARRLYERVGFRTEGLLRDAALIEEAWVNVLVMALLRSEHKRPG